MTSRPSVFAIRQVKTDQHSEAEAAVTGVPLEVDRLGAPCPAQFVQVALDDVGVVAGDYGGPIHSRGDVPSDRVLVALQMGAYPGHWNHHAFTTDAAWVYGPGAEHDGVGLQATPFAAVSVPAELAGALRGDGVVSGPVRVSTGPPAEALRAIIADLVDLAPPPSPHPDGLAPEIGHPARAALVEGLVNVLRRGDAALTLAPGAAARVVDQCIQAAAHLGPRPSPLDLSAATGLSDRRIRAAFNERFGVPVAAYFRYRALHGTHRDLVHARPGQTTVAATATDWGFWHLGRFSAQYRDQFGMSPRSTLARDWTE